MECLRHTGIALSKCGACINLASCWSWSSQVTREANGGFVAECLPETIVTEGDTWVQLRCNLREAVTGFHFDSPGRMPKLIGIRA